jgi:TonB family protein
MDENGAPLTLLPQRRLNWGSFATGYGLQAVGLMLAVLIGILQPEKLIPIKPAVYQVVQLTDTPPPQRPAVRPPKHLLPVPPPIESPKLVADLMIRAPRPLRVPEDVPRPELPRQDLANVLPPVAPRLPQVVHTGAFSTGSQAVPTINKPARDVQTSGFGDPNGLKGEGKPGAKAMVASLGSFDLPPGPAYGNGTGRSRGARGTVASVGFGNGVAVGSVERPAPRGAIQKTGFGDARPVAEAPRPVRSAPETPVETPVQILSKPNPVYTEEARKLRLEGEVLLEVAFPATGDCHVVRVVNGLGHGLDEAAVRAAQQIRFRPATRNGVPVDATATVHVVFQLAY